MLVRIFFLWASACSDYNIGSDKGNETSGDTAAVPEQELEVDQPPNDTGATSDTEDPNDSGDSDDTADTNEPSDTSEPDTAVDTGEGTDTEEEDPVTEDTAMDTGTVPSEPVEADCVQAESIPDWLDQFQVPNDGKVYFCHSGSGSSYTIVNSDISSCMAHLSHSHDVFPTTLCDS